MFFVFLERCSAYRYSHLVCPNLEYFYIIHALIESTLTRNNKVNNELTHRVKKRRPWVGLNILIKSKSTVYPSSFFWFSSRISEPIIFTILALATSSTFSIKSLPQSRQKQHKQHRFTNAKPKLLAWWLFLCGHDLLFMGNAKRPGISRGDGFGIFIATC